MENKRIMEAVTLTKKAAIRINAILEGEKKTGYALRISVVGGGCSGMSYNIAFDNKKQEFDASYLNIENSICKNYFKKIYKDSKSIVSIKNDIS